MLTIKNNIQSWYAINLIEGEGVGTAYEYYVKFKKLSKFINSIGRPKRILIAGLPEKYGLSMDFFWLGGVLNAETVVVDDRFEALERAVEVLSMLTSLKLINETDVSFIKTDKLSEFNNPDVIKKGFDLALSSEVLQRLNETQGTYISNITRAAKYLAIFVPNRGNESHVTLSGLKSIYLHDLLQYTRSGPTKTTIYDYGYIDMPPFPPGLSRSREKRQKASKSRFEAFLMDGLQLFSMYENIVPANVKERIAHIAYFIAKIG